ncbi:segregation and condensation protein A [Salisaeta longa]|uniref:segregation and condensation protein A n=1 Tax=Salisaeta longa TaxID=503170 RepID=UPI00048AE7F9|nr:segregation/condensation protein A [Salisaeta longa]
MYRVELQQFEGPMDLLLYFIRRDEVDIHDIPIADIADEYLAYVRVMEDIDLDGVADFIYMAALLINIKARTLLPSDASDEEEGEGVDPRRELVERLLEYVRFKEAAEQLALKQEDRLARYTRRDVAMDRNVAEANHEVSVDGSVYDLVQALGWLLTASDAEDEGPVVHEVEPLAYNMEQQQTYVMERLATEQQIIFKTLVQRRTKPFVIATFLAVLELARQQHVHLYIGEDPTAFVIEPRESLAAAAHESHG